MVCFRWYSEPVLLLHMFMHVGPWRGHGMSMKPSGDLEYLSTMNVISCRGVSPGEENVLYQYQYCGFDMFVAQVSYSAGVSSTLFV